MIRRDFLRGLLSLGAATAAGVALVEPEPVRRYWQVGRNAPVGYPTLTREHVNRLFAYKSAPGGGTLFVSRATYIDLSVETGMLRAEAEAMADALPRDPSPLDDHAAHIDAHMEALRANPGDQATLEHIAEHVRMYQDTHRQQLHFTKPVAYDDSWDMVPSVSDKPWDLNAANAELDRCAGDIVANLRAFGEAPMRMTLDEVRALYGESPMADDGRVLVSVTTPIHRALITGIDKG